jgi:hypothetical protein
MLGSWMGELFAKNVYKGARFLQSKMPAIKSAIDTLKVNAGEKLLNIRNSIIQWPLKGISGSSIQSGILGYYLGQAKSLAVGIPAFPTTIFRRSSMRANPFLPKENQ